MALSPAVFHTSRLPILPGIPLHRHHNRKISSFPKCSSSTSPAAAANFNLRNYWTSLIPLIDSELDSALSVRYPEKIFLAMRHSVLAGGAKRAPPIMCIAACELFGVHRSIALPAASALEMVHAASLVHDDLPCFDAATTRRGRPSTHALFGVDMAVLAGDALFPLCYSHVTSRTPPVPAETLLRVLAEIARSVGSTGMAAGQYLDIEGATANKDQVLLVVDKKFGELGECCAACGAMLGGAGEEEEKKLRRYGRAVSVLYHIVDDILMEEAVGVGNNGREGKMRSNASVVKVLGMKRTMEVVEELRATAVKQLEGFEDKYGDRVLPLYSFVDYAVERGFVVEGGDAFVSSPSVPAASAAKA